MDHIVYMIPIIVSTAAAYNINSNLLSIEVTIKILMHMNIIKSINIILILVPLMRSYHIVPGCPLFHSDY